MQIKHYKFTPENIDKKIFNKLLNYNMYSLNGVMRSVYTDPEIFCKEGYLSVLSHRRKPLSVLFLGKDEYYGWDYTGKEQEDVQKTFGLIAFFTSPDYRGNGYAKMLFQDFDNSFKIRKLSASIRAEKILKSVPENEKVIISNA